MSIQEEHAPSAPLFKIGDNEAGSDAEQASSAYKRRETGLTKCEDEYSVSKRCEALSAKANTGEIACGDACEAKLCENSQARW